MLLQALIDAFRRTPQSLAVSDGTRALTYRELTRLAAVMKRVIARQTDCPRVGIMLPASTVFPAVLFGTFWAKRIAVPLNFLLRAEELARVVGDAEIDVVCTVKHFETLAGQLPARPVYLEDLPLKRGMVLQMLRPLPPVPPVQADETAVILYTSGTTAEPKGVELTYGNLHSNCVDCIATLEIDPRQSLLNVLPPFHVFGLTANVLIPIYLGAFVLAIPRFNPLAMVRAIEQHKLTVVMAIPSMFAAVLRTKSTKREAFQSIYLAISGGEPLPDRIRQGFQERFGVILRQGYGLTETSPVVSVCTPKHHREGTVGKPIRNVQLRLVDADGNDVAPGQEGEIYVKSPGVMKGYFRKPEETRQVLTPDGWLRTGDIGRIDADGFLSITGRAKEMLIIGGENVFPREIEAVLESHEGVLQAAVIGVADGLRGEVPVAFVLPRKEIPVTEEELRVFARERLPGFKTPRRVIIREDLPTGPTGKILKRRLRELLSS